MFGEIAQAGRRGAVDLEDGRVAEEHGYNDGEYDGEKPMSCCRGAVGLERPSDGVPRRQGGGFGGPVLRRLSMGTFRLDNGRRHTSGSDTISTRS